MKPTYEQLEQQLAAVVAENAGLKSVLEEIINAAEPEYHEQGMGCGVEDRGFQLDGYSACSYGWDSAMDRIYSEVIPGTLPETPATDAAIANIQAQGVEMLATAYDERAKESTHYMIINHCKVKAEQAREFAAQLRQGAKS